MKALGNLFNSAAKTEILRALYYQPDEVSLRQLARIARVHVRSAEIALEALVNEQLVKRRQSSNCVFFALERSHADVFILSAVFEAAAIATIRASSQSLNAKAMRIPAFIRQAQRMLSHAREGRYGA